MAFNLPKAWRSGYAIPNNVRDEGLQRRTFTTKWAPRGTYDNPQLNLRNPGGFAVPTYVAAEPYGQGVRVTRWLPSGTAPQIAHGLNQRPQALLSRDGKRLLVRRRPTEASASSMGADLDGSDVLAFMTDDMLPEPFGSYGVKAAATILKSVSQLPVSQRKAALVKVLGNLDPNLWKNTQMIAQRHLAAGKTLAVALHTGLARAMSAGIVAELHRTGSTGKYPAAKSQLGLGCYGCTWALGDSATAVTGALNAIASTAVNAGGTTGAAPVTTVYNPSIGGGPTEGAATSDGRLIWSSGAWRIAAPSDKPVSSLSYDSAAIIAQAKQDKRIQFYVGAFPFDVVGTAATQLAAAQAETHTTFSSAAAAVASGAGNTSGAYVQMVTQPSQFDQQGLPWMASMIQASVTKIGGTSKIAYAGLTPGASPPTTWAAMFAAQAAAQAAKQMSTNTMLDPQSLVNGAPNVAKTITAGVDSAGNPVHVATYASPSGSFQFYTMLDFLQGLGIAGKSGSPDAIPPEVLLAAAGNAGVPCVNVFGGGRMRDGLPNLFNCFVGKCSWVQGFQTVTDPAEVLKQYAPSGLFIHPITGQPWGMWLALVRDQGSTDATGGKNSGAVQPWTGDWNENSDHAEGWHLEIGFAPMATVTTWQDVLSDVLDVINFIPGLILQGEAWVMQNVGDALATLACAAVSNPNATAGAVKALGTAGKANPYAGAAAAGVAIASALCNNPPPLPIATNWNEIILLAGALGLAAILLSKTGRSKSEP